MFNKILNALKHRQLLLILKSRVRLAFRISNKNVYAEYARSTEYRYLEKKFDYIIKSGVTSDVIREKSKKIWMCWLQGIENAPELVKACVNSTRRLFCDYDVVVLSEKNIDDYIELPLYIKDKYKNGVIPPAQYTDIVRTALLCKYGGGWIDATVFCTAKKIPVYVSESNLFVYKQIDLRNKDIQPVVASNWLIFAESNHPILMLTQKLLYAYWKKYDYLRHYFIFHLFFAMATRRYPELWQNVPTFDNHAPHIMQKELGNCFVESRWEQIARLADFHKLNRRLDFSEKPESVYSFVVNTNGKGENV